jgi:hypothetical protein
MSSYDKLKSLLGSKKSAEIASVPAAEQIAEQTLCQERETMRKAKNEGQVAFERKRLVSESTKAGAYRPTDHFSYVEDAARNQRSRRM